MIAELRYATEIADEVATIYVYGVLSAEHADPLSRVCEAFPSRVRTLRIDLHGISDITDAATSALRAVLRFWRQSRDGSFRLSIASEHLIATYAEGSFATRRGGMRDALSHVAEATLAQTAAFL